MRVQKHFTEISLENLDSIVQVFNYKLFMKKAIDSLEKEQMKGI